MKKQYILYSIFLVMLFLLLPKHSVYAANGITVDFTQSIQPVNPLTFGIDISGYGNGNFITNDATEKQRIKDLTLGQERMDLNAQLQCGGAGCATNVAGDDWITAIKATGAKPVLIVPTDPTAAANIVKHFNVTTNNRIDRFIVGNEPDNNGKTDPTTYSNNFNKVYDAIKAVDPSAQVGGPATAGFNTGFLQTFLTISGSRVDFLDFHQYGEGGSVSKTEAQLLAGTVSYETNLAQLHTMASSTKAGKNIDIEVGEWNTSWSGDSTKQNSNFNAVWAASVVGHIVKGNGLSLQYADKNGSLGLVTDSGTIDTPMPIYHGIGMFTGENQFQHFGSTLASANTSLPNLEVYASANPDVIIVINKDPANSQATTIGVTGVSSGTMTVWQKNSSGAPSAGPQKVADAPIVNGAFTYTFPAYSITSFSISGTQVQPSVTSNPTGQGSGTSLQVSACLHGFTHCGDNTNPTGTGTATPAHTKRNVTVTLLDSTSKPVSVLHGSLNFSATSGNFEGTIPVPNVPNGSYLISVKVDGYLAKQIPGIQTITAGTSTLTLPVIAVVTGDINNDNQLDILDYNIILSCFGSKTTSSGCLFAPTTTSAGADISDDGAIDGSDYNLFLRELATFRSN